MSEAKPTALYRFFGADGRLLYVGITHRLNGRLSAHKRDKPWQEVARIELEHFQTRELALAVEERAIKSEKPAWNVVHNVNGESSMPERQADSPTGRNAGLVGWFFLTFGPKCQRRPKHQHPQRQGIVEGRVSDSMYLVSWFSWLDGQPTYAELVSVDQMSGWRFYADQEWFDWECEHGSVKAMYDCQENEWRELPGEAAFA